MLAQKHLNINLPKIHTSYSAIILALSRCQHHISVRTCSYNNIASSGWPACNQHSCYCQTLIVLQMQDQF